ncbi:hypothetical protein MHB84_22945 [Paenibacillus sp. FSL F4-0087]|uniref:Uncharacterized protein n=1 Tax=Paenibacillus pabuli TaxID=1472 RepID=A0ABX9BTK0_9BACL|nr:hypothetical protein [Paenibacillus pabuli]RAJ03558.1 hypothetical protein DET54_101761 [Paenibacillus pabuli]
MSKMIKSSEEFEKASRLVSKVICVDERLPNPVFKVSFPNKVVFDFDYVMSYQFWDELEKIMDTFGDSSVIMAVLDPDPVNYYYSEFSQYNWCVLQKGTTADEYWNILNQGPEESPADAILSNSEIVIWLSSSLNWAIWGERSYGICILGFNDEMSKYSSDSCFSIDRAITDLVALNFTKGIPEDVTNKLMKHYSIKN